MIEAVKRLPFVRPLYHFLAAFLGALLYGFPSKRLYLVGVTGTKGKTTTLELMNAILKEAGKKTALLSSTAAQIGSERRKNQTGNTMPGRFFIQRFLAKAVRAGCTYALIEVTSEGVALSRHRFINWNAAFLINLHPEHIEAHGSFEKYRDAKLSFLRYAAEKGGVVFINRDDKNAEYFLNALRPAIAVAYSKADVPDSFFYDPAQPMRTFSQEREFVMTEFNKENVAAAVALARHLGISEETALRAIRSFKGVPGRMEFVQKEPFAVVVDYAHTPDSLRQVYESLEKLKPQIPHSKLICVFGSAGGGRDKWKRPVLGKIAAEYCGAIIVTNEDSYDEDPKQIMREIINGVREHPRFDASLSGLTYQIEDRREAIRTALSLAEKGDIVVITGKGSEEWIHTARGGKIPWNDAEIVAEMLGSRKRVAQ